MKTTLVVLIFTLALMFSSEADCQTLAFEMATPDASSKSVFDDHPKLTYIDIRYKNGEPAIIAFNERSDRPGHDIVNRYYTKFEGDCYFLGKLYPGLQLPKMPKMDIRHLAGTPNLGDSTVHIEVSTKLKRDTVIHDFRYHILAKGIYWYEFQGHLEFPKLKIERSELQKKLTSSYQQWKPIVVTDSTLVITGLIERNGSAKEFKLMLGKPSPFSDKVLQFLSRKATDWWPAKAIRTKRISAHTRIFVRLNRDETVTFSTL